MDKLSDKIKVRMDSLNKKYFRSTYNWGCQTTLYDLLPEIEKLEQEKEELIKHLIKSTFEMINIRDWCLHDDIKNNIELIKKIKGKTWDQITKEQE